MPKISCIVPVYNVEKFLDDCIISILSQTFTDFELILVNDGSTDKSEEICVKYAKIDSRIKVIQQKNSGASVARNKGIENSSGDFICFVDSDDWVDKDFFKIMYANITNTNSDMVVCGYKMEQVIKDNKKVVKDFYCLPKNKDFVCYSRDTFFNYFPILRTNNEMLLALQSPCMRLIRNQKNFPMFDENTVYGEDDLFNIHLFESINSICFIKSLLYYYRYNDKSVTKKVPIDRISDGIWIIDENRNLFEKFCQEKDMKYFWKYKRTRLIKFSLLILNNYAKIEKIEAKKMFSLIRKEISGNVLCADMKRIDEFLFLLFIKLGLEQGNGLFSILLKIKHKI